MMRRLRIISIIAMLSFVSGCYWGITGQVIDAETQQPIEGAVVLVEWTKTHGFGDHWTESYKVVETMSDKDGNVTIAGCYSPFVDAPTVAVYKAGYIAWYNENIFPTNERRTDFKWRHGAVFKLDKFLKSYSYIQHDSFIQLFMSYSHKKALFQKQYYEGEGANLLKERMERDVSKGGR